MNETPELPLHDCAPERNRFREEVLNGLRREPKELPCKYLYDARGSQLFDRICQLDEYYPTRTEVAIMETYAGEMAGLLGPHCAVLEYGSGSSLKTRILMESLEDPVAYVPVDISRDHLLRSAHSLDRRHPDLEVLPVCADFTQPFALPRPARTPARWIVYFPGSTIGNFHPPEVLDFLKRIGGQFAQAGGLLIGVDLPKDRRILEAAYDDREGVTAAFNRNLLSRINRELGADFDLGRFRHRAVYDQVLSRVEMHLVSTASQTVAIDGECIDFAPDEWIHTESSYKYSREAFASFAAQSNFDVRHVWVDDASLFSVQYLTSC
jgi:dimethylhistidine N-methyltransferase